MPSRGLFSRIRRHFVGDEKEIQYENQPNREKTRDSSTGHQGGGRNQILPAITMSDKADRVYEHAENSGGLTRGQKLKRHCARWWWAHLLVFIAIVVLVVCLM